MSSDALDAYRDRATAAVETLELHRPVSIVPAQDWGMRPGDKFTIYCPATDTEEIHVLLHYLAHARMLETGWQQPTFRTEDDARFGYANRSADTFTDFWAYQVVAETFGQEHIRTYTAWLLDANAADIVSDLVTYRDQSEITDNRFATYCTVFAVDWFGMAPLLCQETQVDRTDELNNLFKRLLETRFATFAPGIAERVQAVRTVFARLAADCPSYQALVEDGLEDAFEAYYTAVWPDNPPAPVDGFVPLSAFASDED